MRFKWEMCGQVLAADNWNHIPSCFFLSDWKPGSAIKQNYHQHFHPSWKPFHFQNYLKIQPPTKPTKSTFITFSICQNCLKAMATNFHPECFACAYCNKIFANSPFYLEDGLPYCEEGERINSSTPFSHLKVDLTQQSWKLAKVKDERQYKFLNLCITLVRVDWIRICRLERAVHNEVCLLRIPNWSRRPMGGGDQQQLSLTVLQLLGRFLFICQWS